MASFQIVVICAFVNIVLLTVFVNAHVEENSIRNDDTTSKNAGTSGLPESPTSTVGSTASSVLFERLFQLKRSEQKDALKRITNIQNYEKQKKLLTLVITKIMEVLADSRVKLESSGYLPGSPFPEENEKLRDALSSLIENSAFMGDLVLYLPDMTQKLLKNNEWNNLFKWSLSICQEIPILDQATKKMLHLVAQELNLVERDPNYLNPYAKANQIKPTPAPKASEKKKERRKIPKGPSLTGSRMKNEL